MATRSWQVQEAKTDLSALIRAAEHQGPQKITRNGKDVAVVLSASAYAQLTRAERARKGSLLEFFASWPAFEIPSRNRQDFGREVDL